MILHFRPNENFTRIVELTPALRREIEATIEQLVSILDLFDGNEDLEDDANGEPWLGWTDMQSRYPHNFSCDDREEENEHGGNVIDEPHDDLDEDREEDLLHSF